MNDKHVNSLVGIFYGISALMVLIGAFFRLQHYPNGALLFIIGIILGTITTLFDIIRLKKKNKNLEEQLKQKE